ncbi:hypothetical protein COY27_03025 [Candidatus Woesearchaeota archaeon CG_4_10_14_0_2_um_filter_33_13]|nr:MAG: hypothetical protein COY27_03025 [Candidatus Woesearchaeota archaeon CG_4_10_14_0_2_um_filter_33_13]
MGSLKALQLLVTAAQILEDGRQTFSRQEIVKKINEIKYLSAQKQVPRLSLRKEVIHLENQMKSVFSLEKKLKEKEKGEKHKVAALKRQITHLRKKLEASEDKDLNLRLEKLTHLIGDFMAKHGTELDVELSEKIIKELDIKEKKVKEKKVKVNKTVAQETIEQNYKLSPEEITSFNRLQNHLQSLKHELEIHKQLETQNPEVMKSIEDRTAVVEKKISDLYEKYPELAKGIQVEEQPKQEVVETTLTPIEMQQEIKHTLMLGGNGITDKELIFGDSVKPTAKSDIDDELPMPPPPRMTN